MVKAVYEQRNKISELVNVSLASLLGAFSLFSTNFRIF
jgi:hypothetical protein